jgi:hypothetical protein
MDTHSDEEVLQSVLDKVDDADAFQQKVSCLYAHTHHTSLDEIRLVDGRVLERYSAPIARTTGASDRC